MIKTYQNGNYKVIMFDDGTKVRQCPDNEDFIPSFSENTDVCITKYCDAGCAFCLLEDELIQTNRGEIPIKNIKEGDIVFSFNKKNYNIELKPVIETYCRDYEGELIEIETDFGTLTCTPNHKIYTQNRGFIEAKNIQISDVLLNF